jgi:hypothetical protein
MVHKYCKNIYQSRHVTKPQCRPFDINCLVACLYCILLHLEMGLHRLETFNIGRFFHDLQRQTGEFMSLSAIIDSNMKLTTKTVLKISYRLSQSLDTMHSGSMFVGNLSADKVLVYVKNNQVIKCVHVFFLFVVLDLYTVVLHIGLFVY